jgi:hypothetical protein
MIEYVLKITTNTPLVKDGGRLAHPQFLRKKPSPRKTRKRERLAHGVQAEGIRIIILRRLFFHWVGPVPGRCARGDVFAQSCLWRHFLAGLSLRRTGGKVIRKL